MSSVKVLVGVLAGVAAGALLGVLFAPEKGSETRKKIAKKSGDSLNGIKDKFSDFLDSVNEKLETAKEEADHLRKQGLEKAGSLIEEAKTAVK